MSDTCQCEACRRDGPHDSSCAVHRGPALPLAACDCGKNSPLELIAYEDAERIVRDRLDDITVDENSRCHWAEVANALTHILGELRAAILPPHSPAASKEQA